MSEHDATEVLNETENKSVDKENEISAEPTKKFFVSMFTRDIELKDAIFDLVDNSLDGIMRIGFDKESSSPYEGFEIRLTLLPEYFKIVDNCGGIPKKTAKEKAFRLGRPEDEEKQEGMQQEGEQQEEDKHQQTIGLYGVGMKRAVFKLGREINIETRNGADHYQVNIDDGWLTNDAQWKLRLEPMEQEGAIPKDGNGGTQIVVKRLYAPIANSFDLKSDNFISDFIDDIGLCYFHAIDKGLKIIVETQKKEVTVGRSTKKPIFMMNKHFSPYIYREIINEVEISLVVGFYQPPIKIDTESDDINVEEDGAELPLPQRRSTDMAGWTIVCNERVVLANDKTRVTGWGTAGVAEYHTQFVAIAGVLEFKGDPEKLPFTTTKRGVDTSSDLYLKVKDYMVDGLKKSIEYTNALKRVMKDFKTDDPEGDPKTKIRPLFQDMGYKNFIECLNEVSDNKKTILEPNFPIPPRDKIFPSEKKIVFTRKIEEIEKIGNILLGNRSSLPKDVGNACFDFVLEQIHQMEKK